MVWAFQVRILDLMRYMGEVVYINVIYEKLVYICNHTQGLLCDIDIINKKGKQTGISIYMIMCYNGKHESENK